MVPWAGEGSARFISEKIVEYIVVPKSASFKDMKANGFSFSPSQYKKVRIEGAKECTVRDLLERDLTVDDKGIEIGTQNYISNSPYKFIRTQCLKEDALLPAFDNEEAIPMMPSSFKDYELREGDVLISKDSNIGEVVILDRDYPKHMMSGGIYRLPLKPKMKLYALAFLKSNFLKNQLLFLASRGATIKHAKTLFLGCRLPMPNRNEDKVIAFVNSLVVSLISKESAMRERHISMLHSIEQVLDSEQGNKIFRFEYPKLSKLREKSRINAGYYSLQLQREEFRIKNFKRGFGTVEKLGFDTSRGQNLQISCIGHSIYSDTPQKGFYTLVLPKNISIFGTVRKLEYLGNPKKLKTLKAGDIIFGAEGFEKGRSLVIFEDQDNSITNIHGITLNHSTGDISQSIFVKCFLDYLRSKGLIDLYAVGGNGGSLAQAYWKLIPFPSFSDAQQREIARYYYNPAKLKMRITEANFTETDKAFTKLAGIVQLDERAKSIKNKLDEVIADLIVGKDVRCDYDFIS